MAGITDNVKRWKDGDVYYAKNTFFQLAYVVTHDRAKRGTLAIHSDLVVELISPDQGRLWEAECRGI